MLSAQQVFSDIYERGAWGDGDEFDSGAGSRPAVSAAYTAFVRQLIRESGAKTVVDIGCGDFRVASEFVDASEHYFGIDVVPSLIERNTRLFGSDTVHFLMLDAAKDALPRGDICLVRQVLQHLSNHEIESILKGCESFPHVVITEHYPSPQSESSANFDKPHGGDTRIFDGSWVDITAAPFSRTGVLERVRVAVPKPLVARGETIRTLVWTPDVASSR